MSTSRLAPASRLLTEAVDALGAAAESDTELLAALTVGEGARRRLDRLTVHAVATLQRRGAFGERGYRTAAAALTDLLSCDWAEARRFVVAADQVCDRVGIDGAALPPLLPATAAMFEDGRASTRHVEVVAKVLGTDAAGRLSPSTWAEAETVLAARIPDLTPSHLLAVGTALIDALDEDGAEPDDRPRPSVNELHIRRHRGAPGGKITGRFDDAALFDAVATAIDARSTPVTGDDERTAPQRQGEALADICTQVLTHGDVPECGGRRPHLSVIIRLEDLETRARSATLDFGGTVSPESLRMLACDAGVVPIVMNGRGQPLDVGRLTRVVPEGIRRAVAARDRGCARCGRPPSWCEIHHVLPWENDGETSVENCVMLCRVCHRLMHHSEWQVRITDGRPEFIPPGWIDPDRRPRLRPFFLGAA
ncbi:MAG: DUF222 domain-containing protein [Pseudonocardia sp.]|jgi:5-methylcytosine-specific restriction protein A|uniref:HNH endonuclease n=1 Tax=Pseudonocardia sp. TaxID=60912 RepID=UPI001AC99C9A|nr:HNH endonuclease signature motif containing protein [Pseudonocardia sp.]MBN9100982.1 DUF222 domain-containing protein [Pseudonocardia sp.]